MNKYLEANIIMSKFCNNYMELKKDLPIRPSEMGVLNIIVKREGKFTPLMIAELLEVSKPMITTHIVSLEKKGYIYREVSEIDKRSFFVCPTDKAISLVEETSKKMDMNLGKIEEAIGEKEFQDLLKLLAETNKVLKS